MIDYKINTVKVFYDFTPGKGLEDKINGFLAGTTGYFIGRSIKIGDYGQTQIALSYNSDYSNRDQRVKIITANSSEELTDLANKKIAAKKLLVEEILFSFYKDGQAEKTVHVAVIFYTK